MENRQMTQLNSLCTLAKPLLLKYNKEKEVEILEKSKTAIDSATTNVLICGEFKRGKSSFINAFLEQDVCPVDVDIATSAVSVIKYGATNKVTRSYGDIHNPQSEEIAFDKISQYATGNNTNMLIIEIPNERLKGGLVLIDTPGVGGLDPRHAFMTNYFLPMAHVALFVTDKDQPITNAEIRFFDEKVRPYAKQKAIIINKADLMNNNGQAQDWIDDARKKFGDASLSVIAVSSKLKKLFFARTHDKDDLKGSNFDRVYELIDTLSAQYRKGLCIDLRDFIQSNTMQLIQPVKIQIEQIKEPDPNLIQSLTKELENYNRQKEDLNNPSSAYRMNISKIIREAKSRVDSKLNHEGRTLTTTTLDSIVDDSTLRDNPSKIEPHVKNIFSQMASDIDVCIEPAFKQILVMLGVKGDGDFANRDFDIQIEITPLQRGLGSYASNACKAALPGFGLGMMLTFFTGGAALPIIAGLAFFGSTLTGMNRGQTKAALKTQLHPQLVEGIGELKIYVQRRFDEFNMKLVEILQEANKKLIDNMNVTIDDLTKLKKQSVEQKRRKSLLLENELKPLENLLICSKAFMSNPFDKSGAQTQETKQEPLSPPK